MKTKKSHGLHGTWYPAIEKESIRAVQKLIRDGHLPDDEIYYYRPAETFSLVRKRRDVAVPKLIRDVWLANKITDKLRIDLIEIQRALGLVYIDKESFRVGEITGIGLCVFVAESDLELAGIPIPPWRLAHQSRIRGRHEVGLLKKVEL